ncbi:hypothetical protein HPB52_003419 [Rhipicephalus sanguineus]|uniref:Uncharacterized protein n=1 Tax=Rhipicephalus sanguineus TaxID=34632 RepID=A0A9D4PUB6_RHISA|nr:hypothetical protein HPB52_003419 [Rhipicephalus sanguineus]
MEKVKSSLKIEAATTKRHGPGRLAPGEGRIVLVFESTDDSEQKKIVDTAPFNWSEATQSFCCYPVRPLRYQTN